MCTQVKYYSRINTIKYLLKIRWEYRLCNHIFDYIQTIIITQFYKYLLGEYSKQCNFDWQVYLYIPSLFQNNNYTSLIFAWPCNLLHTFVLVPSVFPSYALMRLLFALKRKCLDVNWSARWYNFNNFLFHCRIKFHILQSDIKATAKAKNCLL